MVRHGREPPPGPEQPGRAGLSWRSELESGIWMDGPYPTKFPLTHLRGGHLGQPWLVRQLGTHGIDIQHGFESHLGSHGTESRDAATHDLWGGVADHVMATPRGTSIMVEVSGAYQQVLESVMW
jgi:hypothetical protein